MASAAQLTDTAAPMPASRKGFGIGALLAVGVISVAASGGATWWLSARPAPDATPNPNTEPTEAAAVPAPAAYLAVEPAFVVNLEDPDIPHYLQVDVQLMSREPAALDTVRTHLPRVRNNLLLLFGQQKPSDLSTREGKDQLRALALAEVQTVMKAETGKPLVDDLYFTSFVMQ